MSPRALAGSPAGAAVEGPRAGRYSDEDGARMELVLRRFLDGAGLGLADVDAPLVCPPGITTGSGAGQHLRRVAVVWHTGIMDNHSTVPSGRTP
jgi:hypothetical protein